MPQKGNKKITETDFKKICEKAYKDKSKEISEKKFKEIFLILYYGTSRPERSLGKHIYETKLDEEKNDGYASARFDILSLLVNMLNPLHAFSRAGYRIKSNNDENNKESSNKAKEIPQEYIKKIIYDYLSSNGEGTYLPNCIFPIYSVDLMLNLIRKGHQFKPDKEYSLACKYEELCRERKYIKDFYSDLKKNMEESLNLMSNGEKEGSESPIIKKYMGVFDRAEVIFID